jgi:mannose-6-phosphate isomerase-like protein (cupin superfamily)
MEERLSEHDESKHKLKLKNYHLDLEGIKPLETPAGRMWNLGDYEGKSSIRYFEFVGFSGHVHIGHDETFYVLGGRGLFSMYPIIPSDGRIPAFLIAGKTSETKISKGSIIHVPRGRAHDLLVPTGLTMDAILITEPEYNPRDEVPVMPIKHKDLEDVKKKFKAMKT